MKVILTQDVAKIGRRFSIVEVPDGYAQNKLIPKRLAEPATPANVKRIEAMAKKHADSAADTAAAFAAIAASLKDEVITVTAKGNDSGSLFEALKREDIAAAVKSSVSLSIEPHWITITVPVKTLGEHIILMEHAGAQAEFTINVTSL